MTKIENRDFALIFSGKRPFNTLSKINLSDIVIVIMNFYLYSAQDTVEPRSKAPANKAMFAYKAFEKKPLITFCSTFYISYKAFSL